MLKLGSFWEEWDRYLVLLFWGVKMGLLSSKEKTPEERRIDELMSKPLNSSVKVHLKAKLKSMAKNGKNINEIERYYKETAAKTKFIEDRKAEYITEAKLSESSL